MKMPIRIKRYRMGFVFSISLFVLVFGNVSQVLGQEGFIGEIRMFAGNFPPLGWAFCDGSKLSIKDNAALFSIIGITYGGNGTSDFALPDLRGRFPMGAGTPNYGLSTNLGEQGGQRHTTLKIYNLPPHSHSLNVSKSEGDTADPTDATIAVGTTPDLYKVKSFTKEPANASLAPASVSQVGSGMPFDVTNPYTGVNFIICISGNYPSRS